MNEIKNSKSTIRKITNDIKNKISNGKYVLIPREKNRNFMRNYRLYKEDVIKLILTITENEYVSEQFDDSTIKYGKGTVIVYIINHELIDFHGNESNVEIYIKIKYKDDMLPIISIHETEK